MARYPRLMAALKLEQEVYTDRKQPDDSQAHIPSTEEGPSVAPFERVVDPVTKRVTYHPK